MKRNPFLYAFKEPSDAEVYTELGEVRKRKKIIQNPSISLLLAPFLIVKHQHQKI